ncbi:hypothetical protein ES708_14639 [subsurface metagenome]
MSATIISFQFIQTISGIIIPEIQYILDFRPSEGVDALGIITNHTNIIMNFSKPVNDIVLNIISVLVFINKDITELIPVFFQYLWEVPEQNIGINQEIVKVHRTGFETSGCIDSEYL